MMDYYDIHAKEFIDSTIDCNMNNLYNFFNKYLKDSKTILDLGFGSARDMLYFKGLGLDVYGIDTSSEMIKNALNLGLSNVSNVSILDYKPTLKFDAIWACASLLHINSNNLNKALINCSNILNDNKYMYLSFKYGTFEGIRNSRYYLDMTLDKFKLYLDNTNLIIVDSIITEDVRDNNSTKWLNIILKKNENL